MAEDVTHRLPVRLKQARLLRGLTLEAVAEALGSSFTSIWRYESGQRRPNGDTLYALAELYRKPVEWFYKDETDSDSRNEPDDIDIADPELSLFFRGEWEEFDEEEKEFIKGMIRESRELLRKRREGGR